MARARRRIGGNGLEAWPGYVDALSTFLIVIMFILMVFVLAQAFLSSALSGRTDALEKVSRQLAQVSDMLSLERGRATGLRLAVTRLGAELDAATSARDRLAAQNQAQAASAMGAQAALGADLAQARAQGQTARTQLDLLSQQVEALRAQLAQVSAALDLSNTASAGKDKQIADLGAKLNVALAAKVEELKRYRSEFFGRLREVLANRPGITIVGDRFVFQSEVLFPVGGADLTQAGGDQIDALAKTILAVGREIPPSLPWIMRVDGHADRQPVTGGAFASNWELSAARAITVVKLLIAQGVPADHLAATAFGDTQPLAAGDTPADYARNRRIELRLTDR